MNRRELPEPGEFHTIFAPLSLLPDSIRRYEAILSRSEREHADSLRIETVRSRWITGRGILRETVAEYLGEHPADISFESGSYGKPGLAGNSAVQFNLSHSGDLLLIAIANSSTIGVDLEEIRSDLPLLDMARLAFSPREQRDLLSLPEEERTAAFFRCWTRKEACMKACGRGFSLPSDSFDVTLLPGIPAQIFHSPPPPSDIANFRLADVPSPQNFCAAVAISIKCYKHN